MDMNSIIRKRIKLFALAVLLLTCICQTGVATASTVSISPQPITVSQGDTFILDVVVDPAGNEVYIAECTLRFDNAMLEVNEQNRGEFLSSDGATTIEMLNGINNGVGKVEYGESRREVVSGVTESGVLTSISFEALGSGTCNITLDASLYDPETHPIGEVVTNGATCIVEESTVVTTTATDEPEQPSNGDEDSIPGFGAFCSITGLVVASFLASRRN